MALDIQQLNLYNPGVLKTTLSDFDFREIKDDMFKQIERKEKYNNFLSGHIEKEYSINVIEKLENILLDMYAEYSKRYNYYVGRKVACNKAWVNIQKKHEFNPLHVHDGIVAWVIWVQIPYDLKEELNLPMAINSYAARTSLFEFVYSKMGSGLGTENIHVDKKSEGTLIMFPAYLKHCVYPFYTSDDYRISMASNIKFKE